MCDNVGNEAGCPLLVARSSFDVFGILRYRPKFDTVDAIVRARCGSKLLVEAGCGLANTALVGRSEGRHFGSIAIDQKDLGVRR